MASVHMRQSQYCIQTAEWIELIFAGEAIFGLFYNVLYGNSSI